MLTDSDLESDPTSLPITITQPPNLATHSLGVNKLKTI